MYACTLQCDQNQLGNLYSVLSRRRGDVVNEDIIEGTSIFILKVILPIVESFGFSQVLDGVLKLTLRHLYNAYNVGAIEANIW